MSIRIVTDSTCDLPRDLIKKHDITVVPVFINIGENSYKEGVDISRQKFYDDLETYDPYPTTAAPATGMFAETYARLAAEGATQILSIHLAETLSATYNAARLAAEAAAEVAVTLFDTGQITLGSGLLVQLAAEALANGRSLEETVTLLQERVPRTYVFGMLDTLDSLRRSGRVNWAEFGIGTLLQIKPLMMIHQGEISVPARVRTSKRALRQMITMVEEMKPFERLGVIHVRAPEAAADLYSEAATLFPEEQPPLIIEVTPAIGTHLGLGAVGFAGITKNNSK